MVPPGGQATLYVLTRFPLEEMPLPTSERCQLWKTRSRLRFAAKLVGPARDIDWCEIPGGPFWMGLNEEDADKFIELHGRGLWLPKRELPGHMLDVAPYAIGRNLFTVQ